MTIGDDQKKGVSGLINFKAFKQFIFTVGSSYNYSNGFRNNQFLGVKNSNKRDGIVFEQNTYSDL